MKQHSEPKLAESLKTVQQQLGLAKPPMLFSELWRKHDAFGSEQIGRKGLIGQPKSEGKQNDTAKGKLVLKPASHIEVLIDGKVTIFGRDNVILNCDGTLTNVPVSQFINSADYRASQPKTPALLMTLELNDDGTILKSTPTKAVLKLDKYGELEILNKSEAKPGNVLLLSSGIDENNRLFYKTAINQDLRSIPMHSQLLDSLFVLKDGLIVPARESGIWTP
jgi:hypothetical protein